MIWSRLRRSADGYRSYGRSHRSACCQLLGIQCPQIFPRFFMPQLIISLNPLTPNDPYSGRTAPLTSKRCILYIYTTNIGTEYFKYGIYSQFFFSSKTRLSSHPYALHAPPISFQIRTVSVSIFLTVTAVLQGKFIYSVLCSAELEYLHVPSLLPKASGKTDRRSCPNWHCH